ncbi:unnamed protein product [Ceratitis capitata]|uniref:(Mediterranean fruit fly) hypothetical protein n=1 Tax=Ceratitis capitata TaxID=7213 RepID=A0A811UWN6_CERCA|nr:unnamed protein product [Ceratitis capitata]
MACSAADMRKPIDMMVMMMMVQPFETVYKATAVAAHSFTLTNNNIPTTITRELCGDKHWSNHQPASSSNQLPATNSQEPPPSAAVSSNVSELESMQKPVVAKKEEILHSDERSDVDGLGFIWSLMLAFCCKVIPMMGL